MKYANMQTELAIQHIRDHQFDRYLKTLEQNVSAEDRNQRLRVLCEDRFTPVTLDIIDWNQVADAMFVIWLKMVDEADERLAAAQDAEAKRAYNESLSL